MDGDRRFHIVEEDPSIRKQKPVNSQLKEPVIPSPLCRSSPRRSRHIGGAVLADKDMNMRLLHQKLIQRYSPAQKGVDSQCGLNFVCRKQRFRAGGLVSVD